MQIDIQARNFPMTDALRNHTERRLGFALSARDDHIQRVIVRLSDINGPRGGAGRTNAVISRWYSPTCRMWLSKIPKLTSTPPSTVQPTARVVR